MKIFISGIGGSGANYLARYYKNLGYEVYGSDKNLNKRIESLDILQNVIIGEPNIDEIKKIKDLSFYIYSSAFDDTHPERLYFNSLGVTQYEVGDLTDKIITNYKEGKLNDIQIESLKKSELLPLINIDWNKKKYIAVTGTDGKTTTVNMIYHILKKLGKNVAMISTVGMMIGDKMVDTGFHTTTPSSQELYNLLIQEELNNIEFVIIETTSHSLAMGRIAMAKFDISVITNITTEHLDYHRSWQNYFDSKARLIKEHLKDDGVVILNSLDEKSYSLLKNICLEKSLNYRIIDEQVVQKILLPEEMSTVYNKINAALSITTVKQLLGDAVVSWNDLSDFKGVEGRMEYIRKKPFSIIIDFAHTQNSLEVLLFSLKSKINNNGKLRVVFACLGFAGTSTGMPRRVAWNCSAWIARWARVEGRSPL